MDAAQRPATGTIARLVRLASHATVWTCVLVPSILVLTQGWTPLGDYAAIELRSYQTFSAHPPLVGMFSTAGSGLGHTVFDPGPLSFWLLATPVHLDPAHGLVWGSALLWGLVLSLAIEALWRSGCWPGCAAIALFMVDLLWNAPFVLKNLAWNANFPLPFFVAGLALAYLVARGRFGWWPVLVVLGSVAAQAHLLYTVPSAALVVLAPVVGVLGGARPTRWRWLPVGIGVGLACWAAPVVQAFGSHSNLSALARGTGVASTLGFGFGLRLLGDAASPRPIWLAHTPTGFFPEMSFIYGHGAALGIGALALLGLVALGARMSGHHGLFAVSTLTVVVAITFAASFGLVPASNLLVVGYLLVVLWMLGALLWLVLAWALVALLAAAWRRFGHRLDRRVRPSSRFAVGSSGLLGAVAGAAVLVGLFAGLAGATSSAIPAGAAFGTNWTPEQALEAAHVTTAVERRVPKGPVNVRLIDGAADPAATIATAEGVGWQLTRDGWRPGLLGVNHAFTSLPPLPGAVELRVTVRGNSVERVTEIRRPPVG